MKHGTLLIGLALLVGCGSSSESGSDFSPDPPTVIGTEDRPASVAIPKDYDSNTTYPLLMVLHGAGADGQTQAGYFQLFPLVDEKQFVMVYPNGELSDADRRLWNGAGCCTSDDSVDDVGYLSDLIEEAKQTYNVDPKRVYLMGHSNGGFMSFRMACERTDLITAIVSLAGSTFDDPADCQPATLPVSVLAVHSTNDGTIFYDGGTTVFGGDYPGAVETVERFAAQAGCDVGSTTMLESIDLTNDYDGAETERVAYTTGCDAGLDAELWTLLPLECAATACNPHIPVFTEVWADVTTDWLFRHSR